MRTETCHSTEFPVRSRLRRDKPFYPRFIPLSREIIFLNVTRNGKKKQNKRKITSLPPLVASGTVAQREGRLKMRQYLESSLSLATPGEETENWNVSLPRPPTVGSYRYISACVQYVQSRSGKYGGFRDCEMPPTEAERRREGGQSRLSQSGAT